MTKEQSKMTEEQVEMACEGAETIRGIEKITCKGCESTAGPGKMAKEQLN
jgi:hypothetical protein